MLLRCPSCSARYEIATDSWPADEGADGELVLRPRKVRCRRCQEVWLATPEVNDDILDPGPPLAEPVAAATPVPAFFANRPQSMTARAEPSARKTEEDDTPRKPRRLWPWLLVAAIAGGAGYAAVATNIVDPEAYGLPPLASWAKPDLSALSLPAVSLPTITLPSVVVPQAPAPKLTLKTSVSKDPIPGGGSVWIISGTITNPTTKRLDLPPIELELISADGTPLTSWSIRPPAQTLGPGKQIPFETTALNPLPEAKRVRVTLKPASLARL